MGELLAKAWDVVAKITWNVVSLNPEGGKEMLTLLSQPGIEAAALVALVAIVFFETGCFGFFLPGDSLLVVAGVAARAGDWNLGLLVALLCVAAIVGDSVGYAIGRRGGPALFHRDDGWFFHKAHLLHAQHFYERHGGKTIILARFVPIVRTFAPLVAGVGRMEYARFLAYNVFGGIGWVVSMVLTGYYLKQVFDPFFQWLLRNPEFTILHHLEKVIVAVIVISVLPGVFAGARSYFGRKAGVPIPAAGERGA